MANKIVRNCEFCGKQFETDDSKHGQRKRFCNTSCSAKWRNKTFGANVPGEEARKQNSKRLHEKWLDPEFRSANIERMKNNNPVYMEGVVDKAKATRVANGGYENYFKFGNGRISKYEEIAYDYLKDMDFKYNFAIGLKDMIEKYPNRHYPKNYKPDFTNLDYKICIEIDGPNHKHTKSLDDKKDECLIELGYKVFRFTHEQIDNGEFYKGVDSIWENYCQ